MSLRLFFVAGWRSHLALFRWVRPSAFIPTVLCVPVVQLLWFVHLGRYLGTHPVAYYAVGNAVHGCAMAGLFAPAMSVQGERTGGTLSAVLATPASNAVMFAGRIVPAVATGFLTSTVLFVVSTAAGAVRMPAGAVPPLIAAVLLSAVSTSCCGLLVGAFGLIAREATLLANLVLYSMLLLCGVNVPVDRLPGWLQPVSAVMPMTHGLEAARRALSGAPDVTTLLCWELGKAAVLLCLALIALRCLEFAGRRGAVLDTA
ncbi:ABC transporter permease [Streptomyces sp. R44]|uniref:Transport permease protein n=1 Tax=Streptomyces sp. R44 TaxID=3238633 RepID=A0AB39T7C9_9ACTN